MIVLGTRKTATLKFIGVVTAFLFAANFLSAEDKKPAVKAPSKAAPAAKGAPAAGRGPTTAGRGPTTGGPTTAGRGPTTNGARAGEPAGARGGAERGGAPGGERAGARAGEARGPAGRNEPRGPGGAAPRGSTVARTRGGDEVRRRADGRPGDVHVAGRNMDIHHGLVGGGRRVEVERAIIPVSSPSAAVTVTCSTRTCMGAANTPIELTS